MTLPGAAIMKPASDILERIYAAADSLFEQNGCAAYPTVDAVRKTARVNMNDANSGMREWRRNQMARAVPALVPVPAVITEAQAALVAELWQAAQALAGESLAAAQSAWDAERTQFESLNREMADAFETQAAELETVQGQLRSQSEQIERAVASSARLQLALDALQAQVNIAEADAGRNAMRAQELERRALELREELDHAHQALAAAHADCQAVMRAHGGELAAVRADARQAEALLLAELEASRQQQLALMKIVSNTKVAGIAADLPYNEKDVR
jgi:hypothetical protein